MHPVRATHDIRQAGVTKGLVARLAGVHRPHFIQWTLGKADLSPEQLERVSEVIGAIKEIVAASEQLGVAFDLKNAQNVQNIINTSKKLKVQAELQDAEADLQRVLGEAASVFSLTLS
jgi:hypothetical protein